LKGAPGIRRTFFLLLGVVHRFIPFIAVALRQPRPKLHAPPKIRSGSRSPGSRRSPPSAAALAECVVLFVLHGVAKRGQGKPSPYVSLSLTALGETVGTRETGERVFLQRDQQSAVSRNSCLAILLVCEAVAAGSSRRWREITVVNSEFVCLF
ncbi:MAG: hypothetical protein ACRD3O_23555, partial [Terriglobia bacterium]